MCHKHHEWLGANVSIHQHSISLLCTRTAWIPGSISSSGIHSINHSHPLQKPPWHRWTCQERAMGICQKPELGWLAWIEWRQPNLSEKTTKSQALLNWRPTQLDSMKLNQMPRSFKIPQQKQVEHLLWRQHQESLQGHQTTPMVPKK